LESREENPVYILGDIGQPKPKAGRKKHFRGTSWGREIIDEDTG